VLKRLQPCKLLRCLFTFDTSNYPGNTRELADFRTTKFEPLGAKVEIIPDPGPKRNAVVHFIARLRDHGSKNPVLLAAHPDADEIFAGDKSL